MGVMGGQIAIRQDGRPYARGRNVWFSEYERDHSEGMAR